MTITLNAKGIPVVETRFHVRFHETDAMGVVHHAAYITWFEEGRSEFMRTAGYPYSRLVAGGINLAIVDVVAHYVRPARYDDEVIVMTSLDEVHSRSVIFAYEIRIADAHALLVTGSTRLMSVDDQGQATRLPDAVLTVLRGAGRA